MKLTAYHKRAFVSGIMADTPIEPIKKAIEEVFVALEAANIALLPPAVRAIIDTEDRDYICKLTTGANIFYALFEDERSRRSSRFDFQISPQAQQNKTINLYGTSLTVYNMHSPENKFIMELRKSSQPEAVNARNKWMKLKSLITERQEVEVKLKAFIDSVSTRKQVMDRHPEFEKYLPKETKEPRMTYPLAPLPIKDDLLNLGWKPAAKTVSS